SNEHSQSRGRLRVTPAEVPDIARQILDNEVKPLVMRGWGIWANRGLCRRRAPDHTLLLNYHDVADIEEDRGSVSPPEFSSKLRWLKGRGYAPITLKQLISSNGRPGGKYVLLTFDDGRQGVAAHGLPLIDELGFTAIVYVIPDFLGTTRWFSYHKEPPSW